MNINELKINISKFYPINLLEGEGVGQTYEYFVKWRVFNRFFKNRPFPKNILIAGLPSKYGLSLDLLMLANFFKCSATIIDEREENIERFKKIVLLLQKQNILSIKDISFVKVNSLVDLGKNITKKFDLVINSEVLQRLSPVDLKIFLQRLANLASLGIFFVPNKYNSGHIKLSKLATLGTEEVKRAINDRMKIVSKGYLDFPPFPPGLQRSETARQRAADSKLERIAMKSLEWWGIIEIFFPPFIKKRQSHIIYFIIRLNKKYG